MPENNKKFMKLVQKADIEVADLISDGGYLKEEQSKKFIVDLIKQAVIMKLITVEGIKSHTKLIDKVGLNGRVLRPGTSGQALSAADRAKPATDQVTLNTHLFKGEIDLNDEVVEDQIEQGTFKQTVMRMMQEQIATDMDELIVNGDSSSADAYLASLDGMLKLATSHVVAAGTNPIQKEYLKRALKAMPSKYNRNKGKQRFFTSDDAELDYRDYLANRATGLGDQSIQGDQAMRYGGRPILPVPVFPDNLGSGTDETNILLLDPKNAYWGIWRNVKIQTDYDTRAGIWYAVATLRAGFQYIEEDAVVKVTGIQTQ